MKQEAQQEVQRRGLLSDRSKADSIRMIKEDSEWNSTAKGVKSIYNPSTAGGHTTNSSGFHFSISPISNISLGLSFMLCLKEVKSEPKQRAGRLTNEKKKHGVARINLCTQRTSMLPRNDMKYNKVTSTWQPERHREHITRLHGVVNVRM
ncbi:hypothetical protein WAI453_009790 [Rhynchosporium graminicola]